MSEITRDIIDHILIVISVHSPILLRDIKLAYEQYGSIDLLISAVNYCQREGCTDIFHACDMRIKIK